MKIIAIEHETPGLEAADFQPHLKPEAARLWQLSQAGVVRESYFRREHDEAVLVLECASLEEARQALESLPLVQNGLITFELIPLRPYPGFERLFSE